MLLLDLAEIVAGRVYTGGSIDRAQVLQVHRVDILRDLDRLRDLVCAELLRDPGIRVHRRSPRPLEASEYLVAWRLVVTGLEGAVRARRRVRLQRSTPILVAVLLAELGPTIPDRPLHPDPPGDFLGRRLRILGDLEGPHVGAHLLSWIARALPSLVPGCSILELLLLKMMHVDLLISPRQRRVLSLLGRMVLVLIYWWLARACRRGQCLKGDKSIQRCLLRSPLVGGKVLVRVKVVIVDNCT